MEKVAAAPPTEVSARAPVNGVPQIIDVSPRWSNSDAPDSNHSVTGRMLSIASSPDGEVLYAGSYSNLWASDDGGQSWEQLVWPQPPPSEYEASGSLGGWCVVDIAVALGWRVEKHPRFLARLRRKGPLDIVGFGECGVWTALGNGNGTFREPVVVVPDLGYQAGGWRVDRHPRFVVDLTGDGRADLIGFGDAGVWTALGNGDGTFQEASFVLSNLGFGMTVLALTAHDTVVGSRGIWRTTDGGSNWMQVHQFTASDTLGQLEWAQGSDHLVYAALGTGLAISKNGGATFHTVVPWGTGAARSVNHVAVWQNAPADTAPAVMYTLGDNVMFVSFDGGVTWFEDPLPSNVNGEAMTVGGEASTVANGNASRVMVISPRWPLEVYVAGNGSGDCTPARLWRGDYSQFPFGTKHSSWEAVVLPEEIVPCEQGSGALGQDSGNVFLATTQRGRGDLLFYGAQRPIAYVGPLYPTSGSDWQALDGNVHLDLHGLLLSPDFAATLRDGHYQPQAGTVWLLSDGGIYRSTDGGNHFQPAHNAETLSCVNVAGVAIEGKPPALSLNTGDNDGFYSMDGGEHWSYQDYGGGDNDCSYADPLRPDSILVFTPRWGRTVAVYASDSSELPDARAGTTERRALTGPPVHWNANSFYGNRGSRPIVPGLLGEVAPEQGDYVFVLFPTESEPLLVRTQNILDITSSDEWLTTATGPGQGANVYLQGPPLPQPDLGVVQASGGHAATVFYVGSVDGSGLWTWTEGQTNWKRLVPGKGAATAFRFFVDPYRSNLIYILDRNHLKRSDDGGATWHTDHNLEYQLTWGHRIAISSNDDSSGLGDHFDSVLTDMQFDPADSPTRFAVGQGGAFATTDGVNWTRLLHAGAFPGRPTNCYYDWISNPLEPALYVAFAGRSLIKLAPLPNGATLVTVPDVFELSQTQAAQEVEHAGLAPHFTGAGGTNAWVSSQSPPAGETVPQGTGVNMRLRTGIRP